MLHLLDQVDSAIQVLSGTETVNAHFAEDRRWLEERRAIWSGRRWRVGVLGITSTGKSTLINALLGGPYLPARVRPSSNTLIACSNGSNLEATIVYEDGRTERVPADRLSDRLEELGDEGRNPENREGVKEISVTSPAFLLETGVVLVDSPGLDAWNLERHEEISLRFLLPTLDVVLFLTTAKANSDGRIAGYLSMVGQADKPLILVQNMADTIEPKLGKGGIVEKDRSTVARELLDRCEQLARSCADVPTSLAVLQVSARWALDGDLGASNIPKLVETIGRSLSLIRPRMERSRQTQLHRHLLQIRTRVQAEGAIDTCFEEDSARVKGSRKALARLKKRVEEAARRSFYAPTRAAAGFRRSIQKLGPRDEAEARELRGSLLSWWRGLLDPLNLKVARLQAELVSIAAAMNLREEDYVIASSTTFGDRPSLRVKVDSVERSAFFKQKTRWGSVKRFFRIGGYQERVWTERKLRVDEFVADACSVIDQGKVLLKKEVHRVGDEFSKLLLRLESEVERMEQGLDNRKKHRLSPQDREKIVGTLSALVASASGVEGAIDNSTPVAMRSESLSYSDDEVEFEACPVTVAGQRLAYALAATRFRSARDACLERIGKRQSSRIAIWGWDGERIEQFLMRFFPELSGRTIERSTVKVKGSGLPFREVMVIDALTETEDVETFFMKPAAIFALLDVEQPGSTESQLHSSPLPHLGNAALIPVIQSTRGVAPPDLRMRGEAGTFVSSMLELKGVLDRADLRPVGALANDDDISVSVFVDAILVDRPGRFLAQRDEVDWIKGMSGLGAGAWLLEKAFRQWRFEVGDSGA